MIFLRLKEFYKEQIEEIQSHAQLKYFSIALILLHFWTAIFWYNQGLENIIGSPTETLCWPLLPRCEHLNALVGPFSHFILPLYLCLIFGALFLRTTGQRWWALLALEIFKLSVQYFSYRFMGNYHFMGHIITFVFLLSPYKNFWIRTWFLTIYLGAASLKFNYEWLSGGSLSWRVPFENFYFLQIGTFLVILLEVIVPWYLLSRNKVLKSMALGFLVLFHFISYYWVGFFYPVVMLTLLSYWVFELKSPAGETIQYSAKNWRILPGFIPWIFFLGGQIQSFGNAREFSLTGMDRLFTLNMYDARSECKGAFIVHHGPDKVEVGFRNERFSYRVKCDPIIFLEQGRQLCNSRTSQERIEAYLVSRRWTDINTLPIIREKDLCKKWE